MARAKAGRRMTPRDSESATATGASGADHLGSASPAVRVTPLVKSKGVRTLKVNPRSGIESWGAWPEDVQETLRGLNREMHLTFTRIGYIGERRIFKCEGCNEWYDPSKNGVAVLYGDAYCDPCLITLARGSIALTRSVGGTVPRSDTQIEGLR